MADKTRITIEVEFEHYSSNFPKVCGILVNGERQNLEQIKDEDRRGLMSYSVVDFGLDDSLGVLTLSQVD